MTASNRVMFKGMLLAATILASPLIAAAPIPAVAQIAITLSVQTAPPMLPVYAQPPMPGAGYIWTPGYWHWSQRVGYYWVPGTWVLPPSVGMLWTPPYWGWDNGAYVFHAGYWGPQVGYYGGINYGYGYGGTGYEGGRWDGGNFDYNRTVNNFGSVPATHVYEQTVTAGNSSRVSYAGGASGLKAAPTEVERSAEHDQHVPVTQQQTKHVAAAVRTPVLAASRNKGRPAIAATSRPAQFKGPGVVRAQPAGAGERAASPPVQRRPAAQNAAPRAAPAREPAAEPAREQRPEQRPER
ncbi:MAG TPA: YXWGXW repeat-containing protein [Stellaceae bacterium]|nr:YXWGXW repeat-containing protein [Stellaceae bacterium]